MGLLKSAINLFSFLEKSNIGIRQLAQCALSLRDWCHVSHPN